MLHIYFDRSFQDGGEKEETWEVGNDLPNIATHRIVEIQVNGPEKEYVDKFMGGGIDKETASYYGDLARTIYVNL